MTRHDQLERELRAALRAEADSVVAPQDAWQRNQLRLATARTRRTSRLLSTAAAVVLVLLVGALVAVATRGPERGAPATGDGDPFRTEYQLGPPVQVETVTVDGEVAVHEAVLSDSTGKGPSLCDRVEARAISSGGCTSREPDADADAVALDWLAGTSGIGNLRGVLAGVDARVKKVQIWMSNGDMTVAALKPSGWEDTKLFALTVPADGPRPQRLVAYSDSSGTVLQAVDLGQRFGSDWLAGGTEDVCLVDGVVIPRQIPGPVTLRAVASPGQAHLVVETSDGRTHDSCFPVRARIQGAAAGPRTLVLVVAPEVADVTLASGERSMVGRAPPQAIPGSLWRVAVITLVRDLDSSDSVVTFDAGQHELGALPLRSLS